LQNDPFLLLVSFRNKNYLSQQQILLFISKTMFRRINKHEKEEIQDKREKGG